MDVGGAAAGADGDEEGGCPPPIAPPMTLARAAIPPAGKHNSQCILSEKTIYTSDH